jgi:hypothetical protein
MFNTHLFPAHLMCLFAVAASDLSFSLPTPVSDVRNRENMYVEPKASTYVVDLAVSEYVHPSVSIKTAKKIRPSKPSKSRIEPTAARRPASVGAGWMCSQPELKTDTVGVGLP